MTYPSHARTTGPLLAATGVAMAIVAAVIGRLRPLEPRLLGRRIQTPSLASCMPSSKPCFGQPWCGR